MATWFIDPSASSNGNGSRSSPFRSLSALANNVLQSGDTVLGRSGTLTNEVAHAYVFAQNNTTFGIYDGTRRFIVDCASARRGDTDFLYDGTNDVYYRYNTVDGQPGSAANADFGNIREGGRTLADGKPLRNVRWQGSLSATRALMSAGTYAFDPVSRCIYVLFTGTAAVDLYLAETGYAGGNDRVTQNLLLDSWGFYGAAVHGLNLSSPINHSRFINLEAAFIGGALQSQWTASSNLDNYTPLGNGIQITSSSASTSCTDVLFDGGHIYEVWDSGLSPQVFVSGGAISGLTVRSMLVETCGLSAIEISLAGATTSTDMQVENIDVFNNEIRLGGQGYSGRSYGGGGSGISLDMAVGGPAGSQNSLRNLRVKQNHIHHCLGTQIYISNVQSNSVWVTSNRVEYGGDDGVFIHCAASVDPSTVLLQGNVLYGNAGNGINVEANYQNFDALPAGTANAHAAAAYLIVHNTLINNGSVAGKANVMLNHRGVVKLWNNVIGQSPHYGVAFTNHGTLNKQTNNVFANATDYYNSNEGSGITAGNDLAVDPQFLAGNSFDGHSWIADTSPLRGAGTLFDAHFNPAYRGQHEHVPTVGACHHTQGSKRPVLNRNYG